MHSLHTHKQTHTPQMLYLFVGVFKLISLSPGENINCLPGVKVDDKGKGGGGGKERKVRKTERVEHYWQLEHVQKACFDMTILQCAPLHMQVSLRVYQDSVTDQYWWWLTQCLLRDITFVRVCARTGLHPLMVCLQAWAVSTTSLTDSGNTV